MVTRQIYCDYAASTPVASAVVDTMRHFQDAYGPGNPSSLHQNGRAIRAVMDLAHDQVAGLLGCNFQDLLFTSGGTESDNLAIVGAFLARIESGRNRIVVGAAEHHAVLDAAKFAATYLGADVQIARVGEDACVDLNHLAFLVDSNTSIVSVQHANNEIGSIQPVLDVSEIAHAHGAWFHCDAVQTPITVPFQIADLDADLVTVSSHKIYGPGGVGALYTRVPIQPLHVGGAQERGLRAGSENVLGAVGFGAAAALELERRKSGRSEFENVAKLVDDLRTKLSTFPSIRVNTIPHHSIPTILHISLLGKTTEDILMLLDRKGISASGGSACASGAVEPSHVVKACDWDLERQAGALRLSFGLGTTSDEIDYVANEVGLIATRG